MRRIGWAPNSIPIHIQQDTTLHSLFISGNCSTCFGSNSSTIAADSSNGVTNTRCCRYSLCAPDDGWKYNPKHVEQFPDINKACNVVSWWMYTCIGILLRAHYIHNIRRIRVKYDIIGCFVSCIIRTVLNGKPIIVMILSGWGKKWYHSQGYTNPSL
jgi:hypothetical protein